jgi:putative peptide zinc metalloprotease protein
VLDGNTTLQAAVQETSHRLGHEALTIRDAVRIGHWLIESGLANSVDGSGSQTNSASVLLERRKSQQQQKSVAQLNPLFIKLPLGNPQALIRLLSCFFGWLCSGFFLGIWVAVVMYAIVCVFQSPGELYAAGLGVFTADGWAWMLVTMIGLKVVHELAHGLFCDRFGGSVKETGLVFILFIPMPYVDVTSCWSFRSKWERIAVAAAGMYIEMFVAALAAIAWSFSGDPVLKFHLFNVMLLGSLTTLLFNANFLMRFDGYYMLADFLEIPNLYQKGQQFVNGLGSQFGHGRCSVFGRPENSADYSGVRFGRFVLARHDLCFSCDTCNRVVLWLWYRLGDNWRDLLVGHTDLAIRFKLARPVCRAEAKFQMDCDGHGSGDRMLGVGDVQFSMAGSSQCAGDC